MIGLVLGSGLESLVETLTIERELAFAEIGLPATGVPGHAGRVLFTSLGSVPALIALGRLHLYEGWSATEVAACVRWMGAQGIKQIILTNAAGCLNEAFRPGEWMMLTDHINLTGRSPLTGAQFFDMSDVYSPRMRKSFRELARGMSMVLREGVYAGVPGPQYETPAEVRMLRQLGADAVGMSTVLEAIQARALGIEVAGFSCLTNWAAGLGSGALDHREVLAMGKSAAQQFAELLTAWGRAM